MSNLVKTQDGLLFYDDFSDKSLMWTLSPSDANCLSFGDNGLRMIHNKKYCSYTITEPAVDEYSCIVKLDHIPFNFDDKVILLTDAKVPRIDLWNKDSVSQPENVLLLGELKERKTNVYGGWKYEENPNEVN